MSAVDSIVIILIDRQTRKHQGAVLDEDDLGIAGQAMLDALGKDGFVTTTTFLLHIISRIISQVCL